MACEVLQLSGWIDSDHLINIAGTDHVAGQPAQLTAAGLVELATNPDDVIGLFKNDMVDDVAVGPQAADALAAGFAKGAHVIGTNKYRLTRGALKNGTTQLPYKFPGTNTWAAKNHLFLGAAGLWDNAPLAANDQPFGTVTLAPTTASEVLEFVITTPAPFHATVTT